MHPNFELKQLNQINWHDSINIQLKLAQQNTIQIVLMVIPSKYYKANAFNSTIVHTS